MLLRNSQPQKVLTSDASWYRGKVSCPKAILDIVVSCTPLQMRIFHMKSKKAKKIKNYDKIVYNILLQALKIRHLHILY